MPAIHTPRRHPFGLTANRIYGCLERKSVSFLGGDALCAHSVHRTRAHGCPRRDPSHLATTTWCMQLRAQLLFVAVLLYIYVLVGHSTACVRMGPDDHESDFHLQLPASRCGRILSPRTEPLPLGAGYPSKRIPQGATCLSSRQHSSRRRLGAKPNTHSKELLYKHGGIASRSTLDLCPWRDAIRRLRALPYRGWGRRWTWQADCEPDAKPSRHHLHRHPLTPVYIRSLTLKRARLP